MENGAGEVVGRERGREGGEIKREKEGRGGRRKGRERRRWEMREGGYLNHLHSKWLMSS